MMRTWQERGLPLLNQHSCRDQSNGLSSARLPDPAVCFLSYNEGREAQREMAWFYGGRDWADKKLNKQNLKKWERKRTSEQSRASTCLPKYARLLWNPSLAVTQLLLDLVAGGGQDKQNMSVALWRTATSPDVQFYPGKALEDLLTSN